MLNTLHSGEESPGSKGLTRLRVFYIFIGGSLVYMFVPSFLFTALSYFSWVCWIAPRTSCSAASSVPLTVMSKRADPSLSAADMQRTSSSTSSLDQHLASAWAY
jgi:hypothetical protein